MSVFLCIIIFKKKEQKSDHILLQCRYTIVHGVFIRLGGCVDIYYERWWRPG